MVKAEELSDENFVKENFNNDYLIKAKVIEVNSLEDNDELILRNADIYLKNIIYRPSFHYFYQSVFAGALLLCQLL